MPNIPHMTEEKLQNIERRAAELGVIEKNIYALVWEVNRLIAENSQLGTSPSFVMQNTALITRNAELKAENERLRSAIEAALSVGHSKLCNKPLKIRVGDYVPMCDCNAAERMEEKLQEALGEKSE